MRARPRSVVSYAVALAAVAAMSLVIGGVLALTPVGNLSILYLIVVLGAATRLGRGPAIAAGLAAFLVYDWFFTEPQHALTIAEPTEWLALSLFLVTAVITSELAANERRRALEAERRERDAVLLFDALRLLGDPDLDAALAALAERLRGELPVRWVSISVALGPRTHAASAGAPEPPGAALEVLGPGRRPTGRVAGGPARWIRVVSPSKKVASYAMPAALRRSEIAITSGGRAVGRIALARTGAASWNAADGRVLALIAASIGSVVERAELREATTRSEVLRRTDALKSALLAAVSHDLRTPLASIIASAGSLRQPDIQWTETERRGFVSDIEQEARRLSRIVDNLLDLSRIEAGTLRPDRAWYDVGALVDDVVGRLRSAAYAHPIDVRVPDDLPPVYLDYVEIDQVLSNLIENAVRHTPAATPIHVTAYVEDAALVVEVADEGPGIDPRAIERLFEPFVRGSARGKAAGSGLGLAVARGLVEAHGGHIAVEDRPGGGALFRFTLPLGAPFEVAAGASS